MRFKGHDLSARLTAFPNQSKAATQGYLPGSRTTLEPPTEQGKSKKGGGISPG